jgi:hypothetical protein
MTVTRDFDVTPGKSSVLSLSKLPTGTVAFSGTAFNSSCAMTGDASTASWVAPPVTTTITPGVTGSVTLNFDTTGTETVCANFDDGTDAGGCPDGGGVTRYGNAVPFSPCAGPPLSVDFLFAQRVAIPSPIMVTALGAIATSGGLQAILALYADSGGAPAALIARTVPATLAAGVNEIPVTATAPASPGTYWIAAEYNGVASICGDSSSSNPIAFVATPFGTVPAVFGAATVQNASNFNYYVVGTP